MEDLLVTQSRSDKQHTAWHDKETVLLTSHSSASKQLDLPRNFIRACSIPWTTGMLPVGRICRVVPCSLLLVGNVGFVVAPYIEHFTFSFTLQLVIHRCTKD